MGERKYDTTDPIILTEGMLSKEPGDSVVQFVTKAYETQDAFIFETIRPFCEDKTHMTITKDKLIRALTLLREQEPVEPIKKPGIVEPYKCGACGAVLGWESEKQKFCPKCGREVKWNA